MLNEIEDGIVALLTTKLESARKIGVQKGVEGLVQPAVYASAEGGKFEKIGQVKVKHYITVYVDIVFKSLKHQEARREGINLILEGVVQALMFETLGLPIEQLMPKEWRNTTTDEMDELGLIAYSMELGTHFYISKQSTEEVDDLLGLAMGFFLKPGDETADAENDVPLA
ncbi:MAG: DUF1834 family protein [Deltaproteobacteria bacterium]|nr:DUF1834 family protein [Deltaproteobacteria bacterium]